MITVRPAVESDLDTLVEMGVKFVDCSPFSGMVDLENVRSSVSSMISAYPHAAAVFVAEDSSKKLVGVLVGVLTTMWFSAHRIACELAWWVEPEARAGSAGWRLLAEYERWARDSGAFFLTMSDMTGGGTSDLEQAYLKRGFKLMERSYRKDF